VIIGCEADTYHPAALDVATLFLNPPFFFLSSSFTSPTIPAIAQTKRRDNGRVEEVQAVRPIKHPVPPGWTVVFTPPAVHLAT